MTVRITNIQHFSLHDGNGIRTTVFLKGCNLTCPWCCNPETINYSIEEFREDGILKSFGYDISLQDLEKEILKDEIYYSNGGGVTFSGGEALIQIKNLLPLLENLKEKGINICFETSLSVSSDLLKLAIPYIDELFIDIKLLDKKEAKEVLNLDLDLFLNNLKIIKNSTIKKENITFRIPLNNEYTLKEENLNKIIDLLKEFNEFNVEIFKIHNLAESKYKLLNRELYDFSEVDDEKINEVYTRLLEANKNLRIISL